MPSVSTRHGRRQREPEDDSCGLAVAMVTFASCDCSNSSATAATDLGGTGEAASMPCVSTYETLSVQAAGSAHLFSSSVRLLHCITAPQASSVVAGKPGPLAHVTAVQSDGTVSMVSIDTEAVLSRLQSPRPAGPAAPPEGAGARCAVRTVNTLALPWDTSVAQLCQLHGRDGQQAEPFLLLVCSGWEADGVLAWDRDKGRIAGQLPGVHDATACRCSDGKGEAMLVAGTAAGGVSIWQQRSVLQALRAGAATSAAHTAWHSAFQCAFQVQAAEFGASNECAVADFHAHCTGTMEGGEGGGTGSAAPSAVFTGEAVSGHETRQLCPQLAMRSLAGGTGPECCPRSQRSWAPRAHPAAVCCLAMRWLPAPSDEDMQSSEDIFLHVGATAIREQPTLLLPDRLPATLLAVVVGLCCGDVVIVLLQQARGGLHLRKQVTLGVGHAAVVDVALYPVSGRTHIHALGTMVATCSDGSISRHLIQPA